MPKRLIDFDALWTSRRLSQCSAKARVDYLWIYGIADAGGSFEMTNVRSLWAKVSVIRPELTLTRLNFGLAEYERFGLLFKWSDKGKIFGHWVGSTKTGRLPSPSTKARYYVVCPYPPTKELENYDSRFTLDPSHDPTHDSGHAQDLELDLEGIGIGIGTGFGVGAPKAQSTAAKTAAASDPVLIDKKKPKTKPTPQVVECGKCGKRLSDAEYVKHQCVAR